MAGTEIKGLSALDRWLELEALTQAEFGQLFSTPVGQPSVSKWFQRGRVGRGNLAEAQQITGLPLYMLDPENFKAPANRAA